MQTVKCRTCDRLMPCQQRTIREREVSDYEEGIGTTVVGYATDGQCDLCLKEWGDDEYTEPLPEDTRDGDYERANEQWGESHGGHL